MSFSFTDGKHHDIVPSSSVAETKLVRDETTATLDISLPALETSRDKDEGDV